MDFFICSVNVKDVDGSSLKDLYAIPAAFRTAMQAGRTPLHWAAANGHLNICEILLDWNSTVDTKDGAGDTPFHLAACYGRTTCAEILAAQGADTREVNNFGWNAIHHASWHGHADAVEDLVNSFSLQELLEAEDQAGHRPIHLAVLRGHARVVQRILALGGNSSPAGPCNYTPLHYAARQRGSEIFDILVDSGASMDVMDDDGFTPSDFTLQPNFITGEVESMSQVAGGDDHPPVLYPMSHAILDMQPMASMGAAVALHGIQHAATFIHPSHDPQFFSGVYHQQVRIIHRETCFLYRGFDSSIRPGDGCRLAPAATGAALLRHNGAC